MSLTNSPFWMAQTGGASFYDYEIENSFRLDKDSDHYLSRTPASAGNRQKWTLSWWMKRGKIYDGQTLFAWGNFSQNFIFTISGYAGDNSFDYYDYDNGTDRSSVSWSYKVRDPSAWYHMVLRVDTTEGTASNRIRLYINNQQASDSGGRTNYPSQNISMFANNNTPTYIAHDFYGGRGDGYYADVNFIDGQSLDPTSFAETKSGVWVPKEYTGSYGTNGYFLKFQNSAALGTDSSGNSNNFTVNNASSIDQMPDTPTNNFCTMNSAHGPFHGNYTGTFREGNLFWEASGNASHAFATFPIVPQDDNGYYFEVVMDSMDNARTYIGFVETADGPATGNGASYEFNTKGVYSRDGYWYGDSGLTNGIQYTAWVVGDVIMVAYKQGKVWFGKNGTWFNSGNPAAGTGDIVTAIGDTLASKWGTDKTWIPYVGYNSGFKLNFGADSSFSGSKTRQGNSDENGYGDFYYTPPSGFLAMCTANLPAPAIDPAADDTPEDYFNTVLWTGTGSGQSITGMGFQPDWLWFKQRNGTSDHALIDSVRGVNKGLVSSSTAAEVTSGASNDLVSFDSDGFTTGTPQNFGSLGSSGFTIATWGWKAGGTTVSNTDGSITTTVSTNTDAGFSIIKYTGNSTNGATIGHNLGVTPDHIIIKRYSSAEAWVDWHKGFSGTQYLRLYQTTAVDTATTLFNSTLPNSSVITLGTGGFTNTSGEDYICYAFAEKDGYSKMGSYIGNGSSDGTFIYTGFRPAFIIMKRTDSSANWIMVDNKRIGYNDNNYDLSPDQTIAEEDNNRLDILSNGFKFRSSYGTGNTSGGSYIYIAFAEQPFKYANAR